MPKYPNLYILRHGETIWNLQGKYQGRKDSALTPKGQSQALQQGQLLATIQNPPNKLFSSPQGRAVHTARLAFGSMDGVVLDDRLQEISFGDWEGATRDEIKAQIDHPFELESGYFNSPNGESFEMIHNRVSSFLNELEEPAIIVTHGITSVVLRGLYLGLNQDEILTLSKEQGCIFCLSNGKETILRAETNKL